MAEEYFMVKPEEFQQLVQYYKGQITDSALLNKAGRVAAKEHIIVNKGAGCYSESTDQRIVTRT